MVAKPTPTAPPADVPNRDQPATFSTRADAWVAWEGGDFYPYLTTAVDFVEQEANAAEAARDAAAVSAAAAGATAWVSGASYTAGDVVWSLVNFYPYRAKTTHSGETTDPSADGARWANIALANVQTSATDTTPGRILNVGAFGLGGIGDNAMRLSNVDAFSPSGFYEIASPASGTAPGTGISGAANSNGIIIQSMWASDAGAQFFVNANASVRSFKVRSSAGGTWSPWDEIYTQHNLLGTVSQTGGVPTGSAMQRGSNANGEFVRLADGTQICTQRVIDDAMFTWTFPAAFAAVHSILGAHAEASFSSNSDALVSFGAPSTSSVGVVVVDNSASAVRSDATTDSVYLTAIGRWY